MPGDRRVEQGVGDGALYADGKLQCRAHWSVAESSGRGRAAAGGRRAEDSAALSARHRHEGGIESFFSAVSLN
jgi:hypothetical protein